MEALTGLSFKPVEDMTYEEAMQELMELSRDDSTQLGLESIVSFAGEMEDDMEDRPMSR